MKAGIFYCISGLVFYFYWDCASFSDGIGSIVRIVTITTMVAFIGSFAKLWISVMAHHFRDISFKIPGFGYEYRCIYAVVS
jgi:hypothetical protein